MTTESFQLDVQRSNPALDYISGIRRAKAAGKGLASMMMEIMRLRRGRGKLQPEEYFMYGLYDDSRFTPEAKQTFLGQNNLLLPSPWADIARDKPTFTALLRGLDLPVPETQAIVHPNRSFPGAVPLRNHNDVCNFLRTQAAYPIFGKPFDSVCSMGTAKIVGYEQDQDSVVVGEHRIPVEGIAKMVEELGHAYLFQTLMHPHESIAELIGPCVSSVRMFVMSDDDGVELFRAAWKIPASANDADNFWRQGNMLAGIDVETGKVLRTLIRTDSGTEPIEKHPITDASFAEMTFPHWDQMRDVVLNAATQIPSCHFQGWDVAMTDRGPILVELEGDGGNPIMEQLCFDSGLLTERYLSIVDSAMEREKNDRSKSRSQEKQVIRKTIESIATKPAGSTPATENQSSPAVFVPGTSSTNAAPSNSTV